MDTAVNGFHHVKLPVADLARSRDWYARVLGLQTHIEFVEEGELMGVAMCDPAGTIDLALPPWTRGSNAWRTSASPTAGSPPDTRAVSSSACATRTGSRCASTCRPRRNQKETDELRR
jgi:catechol 2,3-dioxygenase-like lactoylglutathione lyase family enzyme